MATARDELRRLAESLPEAAAEELADVGRVLERQIAAGEVEDVTDPEEATIVLGALHDTPDELELLITPEQAKAYLDVAPGGASRRLKTPIGRQTSQQRLSSAAQFIP